MDFSDLSFMDCTRITSAVAAILGGIMCVKGIMMTAAAVSLASVIGGIFFMALGAGICGAGLLGLGCSSVLANA